MAKQPEMSNVGEGERTQAKAHKVSAPPATKKKKMGRPKTFELNDAQLRRMDKMAMDQCKHRTIAEVLGVCRETLRLRYLSRLIKKGAEGRKDLRRSQRRMSKNHPNMAIFLGKNELGQADKQELTGKDGGPIQVSIVDFKDIKLDDDPQ